MEKYWRSSVLTLSGGVLRKHANRDSEKQLYEYDQFELGTELYQLLITHISTALSDVTD